MAYEAFFGNYNARYQWANIIQITLHITFDERAKEKTQLDEKQNVLNNVLGVFDSNTDTPNIS